LRQRRKSQDWQHAKKMRTARESVQDANAKCRVRVMMRWSGPRMLLRHPVIAILHMIDGRRPAPRLPVISR